MAVLVDSNVLLDVMTEDPEWFSWSAAALADAAQHSQVVISPIIYAEVSARFTHIQGLEDALPQDMLYREGLPYEAAFLAAKVHRDYRRRGGTRTMPLADFFIGAHAEVRGHDLLTRDTARYRMDFPNVALIAPRRT